MIQNTYFSFSVPTPVQNVVWETRFSHKILLTPLLRLCWENKRLHFLRGFPDESPGRVPGGCRVGGGGAEGVAPS